MDSDCPAWGPPYSHCNLSSILKSSFWFPFPFTCCWLVFYLLPWFTSFANFFTYFLSTIIFQFDILFLNAFMCPLVYIFYLQGSIDVMVARMMLSLWSLSLVSSFHYAVYHAAYLHIWNSLCNHEVSHLPRPPLVTYSQVYPTSMQLMTVTDTVQHQNANVAKTVWGCVYVIARFRNVCHSIR